VFQASILDCETLRLSRSRKTPPRASDVNINRREIAQALVSALEIAATIAMRDEGRDFRPPARASLINLVQARPATILRVQFRAGFSMP
jgi:hypothetical protein